jgi:hypothetical protein
MDVGNALPSCDKKQTKPLLQAKVLFFFRIFFVSHVVSFSAEQLKQFVRGARFSLAQQSAHYKEQIQTIWENQMKALSEPVPPDSGSHYCLYFCHLYRFCFEKLTPFLSFCFVNRI